MDVVRELYSKDHHVHNDRQQQVMKNQKQHSTVEYFDTDDLLSICYKLWVRPWF